MTNDSMMFCDVTLSVCILILVPTPLNKAQFSLVKLPEDRTNLSKKCSSTKLWSRSTGHNVNHLMESFYICINPESFLAQSRRIDN